MAVKKTLTRDIDNKMIAGVVAGLAEYFDADVTALRLLTAALILFTGIFPGVILYIFAVVIVPPKNQKEK